MLITFGKNCYACVSKAKKRFLIKDIVLYENFPPPHSHCECAVIILGKAGGVECVLDNKGVFIDKETGDLLEYAKFVLKKAVLGDFSEEEYTPENIAGTLGADLHMDVRDFAASIADINQNGFSEDNTIDLIINTVAVLQITGGVKYVGKAGDFIKYDDEALKAAEAVVKHEDEALERLDNMVVKVD